MTARQTIRTKAAAAPEDAKASVAQAEETQAKSAAVAAGDVMFVSRRPEPYQWDIMGIKGLRYAADTELVSWRVPGNMADRFARHHFCVKGRVVKA